MILNWHTTDEDALLIEKITQRATSMSTQVDPVNTMMDVTACHLNGNPLDLEAMLNADPFDFVHDVVGIREHIDRETSELLDHFRPRFSKR